MKDQTHVALLVTGSIAATKTLDLIDALRKEGFDVSVLLTRAPEQWKWVSPAQAEQASGHPVLVDADDLESKTKALCAAKAILVAPASAGFISRLAFDASDLAHAVLDAARKGSRLFLAPAMNYKMWERPAIRRNCEALAATGATFLGPTKGPMACGDKGFGRMIDVKEMASGLRAAIDGQTHPALAAFEEAKQKPASLPFAPEGDAPGVLVALGGKCVPWPEVKRFAEELKEKGITATYILDPDWKNLAEPLTNMSKADIVTHFYQVPGLQGLEHIKLSEKARCLFFPFIDIDFAQSLLRGYADTLSLCCYLASKAPVMTTTACLQNLPADIADKLTRDGIEAVDDLARLKDR